MGIPPARTCSAEALWDVEREPWAAGAGTVTVALPGPGRSALPVGSKCLKDFKREPCLGTARVKGIGLSRGADAVRKGWEAAVAVPSGSKLALTSALTVIRAVRRMIRPARAEPPQPVILTMVRDPLPIGAQGSSNSTPLSMHQPGS
jgi:hypothetical protein